MDLTLLQELDLQQGRNLLVIILLGGIALALTIYTVLRQRYFWVEPVKIAAAATAVAALGTGLYTIVKTSELPNYRDYLPALQLLKDAPGMFVVPYLASVAVRHLPNVEDRRHLGVPQILEAAFRVFLGFFLLAVLAAAAAGAGVGSELDYSLDPRAIAYRSSVALPILFYAGLLAYFYLEAYLREPVIPRLKTRYLLFSGGSFSFVLLAIHWFSWPLLSAAWPNSQPLLLVVQACFWLLLVGCWLGAMTLPLAHGSTDRALEAFPAADNRIDELALEVDSLSADPTAALDTLHTADYLVTEAAREVRPRGLPDEQVASARIAIGLALKLTQDGNGGHEGLRANLFSLRNLYQRILLEIEKDAPHRHLWENNPALEAIDAALRVTDAAALRSLIRQPAWVQLTAIVAADQNLLPPGARAQVLDDRGYTVRPDIWMAFLSAKFSLEADEWDPNLR